MPGIVRRKTRVNALMTRPSIILRSGMDARITSAFMRGKKLSRSAHGKADHHGRLRLAHVLSAQPTLPATGGYPGGGAAIHRRRQDRKSTRLNSSHLGISYAVFCLKKK